MLTSRFEASLRATLVWLRKTLSWVVISILVVIVLGVLKGQLKSDALLLLPMAGFFIKPGLVYYFLSVFIPFKFILQTFLSSQTLQLVIPLAILFAVMGIIKADCQLRLKRADWILIILTLAWLFSWAGGIVYYGWRLTQLLDFFIFGQLVGCYILGRNLDVKRYGLKLAWLNLVILNVVSATALFGFFVLKSNSNIIESYEAITARASGVLGNPNALSGYITIILTLSLFHLWSQKKGLKQQVGVLVFAGLPLAAVVLTFSRGALISIIVAALSYLVLSKRHREIVLFAAVGILLFLASPNSVKQRLMNIFNPQHIEYSRDAGRLWSIRNVFFINRSHLLFGSGPGSYGGEFAYSKASPTYLEGVQGGVIGVGNTDNQWLQVFAQQGVVGVWLYLLFFKELLKSKPKKLVTTSLVFYLFLGLFIDVFQFYQISCFAWLYFGKIANSNP